MIGEKIERDGKVAVIYSPDYGAGWFTWNSDHEGLLFDPEIVEAILTGDCELAFQIAERKFPGVTIGAQDLAVEWVPKGARFYIHEYDGSESVIIIDPDFGHVA